MERLQADIDTYFRLELVGHMLTDHRWDGFEHHHAFDELVYVPKGKVTIRAGERCVSLKRGELTFIPEGVSHVISAREPSSFMYIGFRTNLADLSTQMMESIDSQSSSDLSILAMNCDEMIQKAFTDKVPLSEFSSQIITFLLPVLLGFQSQKSRIDPKQILSDKIKQYVKQNYNKPIKVSDIAASLYHSPHYLGNTFAAVNGITIKEYALQYKMQKAIWLLQNSGHTVGEIALMLGYDSTHYFSKCFKSYYGFSPSGIKK